MRRLADGEEPRSCASMQLLVPCETAHGRADSRAGKLQQRAFDQGCLEDGGRGIQGRLAL